MTKPFIFIAANDNSYFKKKVVNQIFNHLNSNSLINLEYNLNALIYRSFEDIFKELNKKNCVRNKNFNILIFLDLPNISLKELSLIKSKVYLFQVFGDIPEHFHSFQKYAQFLYDGIAIEEPEYTNHFSNFGLPAFDASIFNHETATILGDIPPYKSLIPLHNRLYEFSFIGRLDKPGRVKMIEELKKKFKNIFVHDSSLGLLSKEELNNIIKNTKYLFNSTSITPFNTYGFKVFPEYMQLQRKSRILDYAKNGCIIFSEILPERTFTTFSNENIPVVEVPRGDNQAKFILDYLNTNYTNLNKISKKTYDSIYQTYSIKNIDRFFVEILNELRLSSKYSQFNLSQKEEYIVNFKYCKYLYFRELKEILKSNSNILNKLKRIIKSTKKHSENKKIFFIKVSISILYTLVLKLFLNCLNEIKFSF